METLKVLKVRNKANSCWKNFNERVITKKNAQENLLLNSEFGELLQILLSDTNEQASRIIINLIVKCLKAKTISATALISLIQQKMPPNNCPKITSMPLIERTYLVLSKIEKETESNVLCQFASIDPRIIPFVNANLLSFGIVDVSSSFVNFLLGDPDLILSASILDDSHYKMSRCQLLAHLVSNIENIEYAEILIAYIIWHSSYQCVLEFQFLESLLGSFSKYSKFPEKLNVIHLELFDVFIESICNLFFKFGIFRELLQSICENCSVLLNEYHAFKIGSLLLNDSSLTTGFITTLLELLSKFDKLNSFAKVCSVKIMTLLESEELPIEIIKGFFTTGEEAFPHFTDELIMEPFTEYGVLVHLGYLGKRPRISENSSYFDLIEIVKSLDNLSSLNIEVLVRSGHFEILFTLFAFKWNSGVGEIQILNCFLRLLCNCDEEDGEAKIIRYSWVVDFFESNFDDKKYLRYLPVICEFVTSSDNVLFAFVKQKISQLLSLQKGNELIQLPAISSLLILFESSQSRQSRLNFLSSSSLSYLHNTVSRNFDKVDTKAIFFALHLLRKLAEILVIDPKDVWIKYVGVFLEDKMFWDDRLIRSAVYNFASAFHIIPEADNGDMNSIKFNGIKFLIEQLNVEADVFAFDQLCSSLAYFNLDLLKKVQISILSIVSDEDEESDETSIQELLKKSRLFNPELLFMSGERIANLDNFPNYAKLWTKLIDEEIERMPRSKFLGSDNITTSKNATEFKLKPIASPFFCNPLVIGTINETEFNNIDDVLKYIRLELIPLIPSPSNLLWYIRPHLAEWLNIATERVFKLIDDQRVKRQLCDYKYLLKSLKTGSSPQALSSLFMMICSIMKISFKAELFSENQLFSTWIDCVTKHLDEIEEFKSVLSNDEFLTSFAIGANILSGCSVEIDSALINSINTLIFSSSKLKDGVVVYSAIEAISKLSPSKAISLLSDRSISSKQRLVALFGLLRLEVSIPFADVFTSDKPDDCEGIIDIILKRSLSKFKHISIVDPSDFKGLSFYCQSLQCPQDLLQKSEARAFDCGNMPGALKYDAIFSYLLGSGFNLIKMTVSNDSIDFKRLEKSTKDPKCLALLQVLEINGTNTLKVISGQVKGFERFDAFSWLKYIGESANSKLKYDILLNCKLLPRLLWPPDVPFQFALKHALSITPVTKVPYVNSTLLAVFFGKVVEFIKITNEDINQSILDRIIEILYNNSDDKSTKVLFELLNYSIENDEQDRLIETILKESANYPHVLLQSFDFDKLYRLKPERLMIHSKNFRLLFDKLGLEHCLIFELSDEGKVYSELKKILDQDCNSQLLLLFELKIGEFYGKSKIAASISIIDLMFIYQKDEIKFEILARLLDNVLEDMEMILFESKKCLQDDELVTKFKSRSSVIPKDIFDKFNSAISVNCLKLEIFKFQRRIRVISSSRDVENSQQFNLNVLNSLQSKHRNDVIQFDSDLLVKFSKLDHENRNFNLFIIFNALDAESNCQSCGIAGEIFKQAKEMFEKKAKKGSLPTFFASIELKNNMNAFQMMGLDRVPVIFHFGPKSKAPKQFDNSKSADPLSLLKFVIEQSGASMNFEEAFKPKKDYSPHIVAVTVVSILAGLMYVQLLTPSMVFHNTYVWSVSIVSFIIVMLSGYMWVRIRQAPFVAAGPNGIPTYISSSPQSQLGFESRIVSGFNAGTVLAFLLITTVTYKFEDANRRRIAAMIMSLLYMAGHGAILKVFLQKLPIYPFSYLF